MASNVTPVAHPRSSLMKVNLAPWIVAAALTVMAIRLADFVNRYAVNIVYWDQWDFLDYSTAPICGVSFAGSTGHSVRDWAI
jgi:hypothetical protein